MSRSSGCEGSYAFPGVGEKSGVRSPNGTTVPSLAGESANRSSSDLTLPPRQRCTHHQTTSTVDSIIVKVLFLIAVQPCSYSK